MEDMLKDQRETSTKLMNMRWRLIEEIFSMIQILPVICILTKVKQPPCCIDLNVIVLDLMRQEYIS